MPVDIDTRRRNVIKVTRYSKKKPLIYDKTPPRNYLQNFRVVKYWALRNHKLNLQDLELLFFLYSYGLFTRSEILERTMSFSWEKTRLTRLTAEGWIRIFRERSRGEVNLYDLTQKARYLVTGFYKKLEGKEPIPTSTRRNVIFKKTASYTDRQFQRDIIEFNASIKQPKQRLSLELDDTTRR